MKYIKLAQTETYDSLYLKVEKAIKKYVNVEEYYYPILIGDIIWSYFQDRFGYTHYLIFTGDNGSGKNSALLVFKYLGYRVFYVVSASAPNYWTAYGSQEEGQVSIAEDEADDVGEDKKKNDLLKAGYQSGGSVPKVDLEGGRTQDNWLVYGLKWLAMEELKIDKKTKGVLHRSIPMAFLPGDVDYNIKDVIRSADDPEFTNEERTLVKSIVATLSIKRIPDPEIIKEIERQTKKTITRMGLYYVRQRIKKESYHWYKTMREGQYEYIHEFKERINEILCLQRKHHEIIDSKRT